MPRYVASCLKRESAFSSHLLLNKRGLSAAFFYDLFLAASSITFCLTKPLLLKLLSCGFPFFPLTSQCELSMLFSNSQRLLVLPLPFFTFTFALRSEKYFSSCSHPVPPGPPALQSGYRLFRFVVIIYPMTRLWPKTLKHL